ncbi:hypothetical protein IGI04_043095 [Brassica rapa subsp. trilocularis]|uniref:Uncharacterized protein n=1 Tax=Brassica rapa subsp. trilocularis TaxID=1813537 RepID=A0ABQ7KKV8_BRACM|nr:hypothetical protein IGI04_043095 [Brassica rapa subsp. trilocularis]
MARGCSEQPWRVRRKALHQCGFNERYHCLSLTKDVPGQFRASLRWLRSLLRGGDPNHFSKMAVKSVERGRLQTGSMKR